MFFNSLTGLPKNVILDTNTLLNACFVAGSESDLAVNILLHHSFYCPIIDCAILDEAKNILEKKAKIHKLETPFVERLNNFINNTGIKVLPKAPHVNFSSINNSDIPIACLAKDQKGWILTSDISFLLECRNEGIESRFPWDVIQTDRSKTPSPHISDIFRVKPLSANEGTIYAQIRLDAAESKSNDKFTICEIKGLGWLYFDAQQSSWVFEICNGITMTLKDTIRNNKICNVAISYNASENKTGIKFILSSISAHKESSVYVKASCINPENKMSFGSTHTGEHHLCGHIQVIAIGSKFIKCNKMKKYFSLKNSAPSFVELDTLTPALKIHENITKSIKLPKTTSSPFSF